MKKGMVVFMSELRCDRANVLLSDFGLSQCLLDSESKLSN